MQHSFAFSLPVYESNLWKTFLKKLHFLVLMHPL